MDFDELEANVFIGSRMGLSSFMKQAHKDGISVLTVESEDLKDESSIILAHMFIQVDDVYDADLLSHFDAAHNFIETALRRPSAVYVHCRFGMSRSAAICAAYLMRSSRLRADQAALRGETLAVLSHAEAVARVRRCRSCTRPNAGFLQQLQLYERVGMTTSPTNPLYRLYQLQAAARQVATDPSLLPKLASSLLEPQPADRGDVFRCRRCRAALFSEGALLPDPPDQVRPAGAVYWLLPAAWMRGVGELTGGNINCHRCAAKLGTFAWTADSWREREAADLPRFTVSHSRVDRCRRPSTS